jgi:hypothetical protein
MVALLALIRPVFSSFSAFFLVILRIPSSTQRMRSISSRRATTGRETILPFIFDYMLFVFFSSVSEDPSSVKVLRPLHVEDRFG